MVVVSHSFPLSGISEKKQWIYEISHGQLFYSSLGLNGFFVISGFFIFQSLRRSSTLKQYFVKRVLRLFPALFVVLGLSYIIIFLVYNGEKPILNNIEIVTYFPRNLSLYGFQATISGVFDSNFYHAINGSLWTIRYEFSLYIALATLYFIKVKSYNIIIISSVFIVFYGSYVLFLPVLGGVKIAGMIGYEILNLGTFFIAGSFCAILNFENLSFKKTALFIVLILTLLSIYANNYIYFKHLLFPLLVLLVGFIAVPYICSFGKMGDMSYGIYIYSFPIQQVLMFYFNLKTYELVSWSCLLSIVCGYLSWHFVEKKALNLKYYKYDQINFKKGYQKV